MRSNYKALLRYSFYFQFWFLLTGMIIFLLCCTRVPERDVKELDSINDMLNASADSSTAALKRLDSIDTAGLSEEDRFFHTFLMLKARDKAMIVATSDSVYSSVREHYSDKSGELYPEVMYMGGRIYTDLGDYPRALKNYNEAADLTEGDVSKLKLRGNILAQKAWLLDNLRVCNEAARCMDEVIRIDSLLNDSVNLMYDCELLAAIDMHSKKYDRAERHLLKSLRLAETYDHGHAGRVKVDLAAVNYYRGDLDNAHKLIREAGDTAQPSEPFLAYAASIYSALDKRDSAFLYASRLLEDTSSHTRVTAFDILLSPKYVHSLSYDTLVSYISEYRRIVHKNYNTDSIKNAMLQNTLYNYSIHDRDRQSAENRSFMLKNILVIVCLAGIAAVIGLLYSRYVKQKKILKLQRQLEKLKKLDSLYESDEGEASEDVVFSQDIDVLRKHIKKYLDAIDGSSGSYKIVKSDLEDTDSFARLQEKIEREKPIGDSDPLWEDLRELINKTYPDFFNQVLLLSNGELKPMSNKIIILIKCGVTPTQMIRLLSREKGTISYWRRIMSGKLMGTAIKTESLDRVIYLLG